MGPFPVFSDWQLTAAMQRLRTLTAQPRLTGFERVCDARVLLGATKVAEASWIHETAAACSCSLPILSHTPATRSNSPYAEEVVVNR